MKIRPVGFESFHSGGQTWRRTDMTKLMVAFRNFANAPKTASLVINVLTVDSFFTGNTCFQFSAENVWNAEKPRGRPQWEMNAL